MKTILVKNTTSLPIRVTGHRELKPDEERELPEHFLSIEGVVAVEKSTAKPEEKPERPRSKSEARRLAAQRGE